MHSLSVCCCYCHSCFSHHTTPNSFAFPLALKQNEALEKAFSQFYDLLSGNPPFCDYLFDLDPTLACTLCLTALLRFYAFKQSTFMPLVFHITIPLPPLSRLLVPVCFWNIVKAPGMWSGAERLGQEWNSLRKILSGRNFPYTVSFSWIINSSVAVKGCPEEEVATLLCGKIASYVTPRIG